MQGYSVTRPEEADLEFNRQETAPGPLKRLSTYLEVSGGHSRGMPHLSAARMPAIPPGRPGWRRSMVVDSGNHASSHPGSSFKKGSTRQGNVGGVRHHRKAEQTTAPLTAAAASSPRADYPPNSSPYDLHSQPQPGELYLKTTHRRSPPSGAPSAATVHGYLQPAYDTFRSSADAAARSGEIINFNNAPVSAVFVSGTSGASIVPGTVLGSLGAGAPVNAQCLMPSGGTPYQTPGPVSSSVVGVPLYPYAQQQLRSQPQQMQQPPPQQHPVMTEEDRHSRYDTQSGDATNGAAGPTRPTENTQQADARSYGWSHLPPQDAQATVQSKQQLARGSVDRGEQQHYSRKTDVSSTLSQSAIVQASSDNSCDEPTAPLRSETGGGAGRGHNIDGHRPLGSSSSAARAAAAPSRQIQPAGDGIVEQQPVASATAAALDSLTHRPSAELPKTSKTESDASRAALRNKLGSAFNFERKMALRPAAKLADKAFLRGPLRTEQGGQQRLVLNHDRWLVSRSLYRPGHMYCTSRRLRKPHASWSPRGSRVSSRSSEAAWWLAVALRSKAAGENLEPTEFQKTNCSSLAAALIQDAKQLLSGRGNRSKTRIIDAPLTKPLEECKVEGRSEPTAVPPKHTPATLSGNANDDRPSPPPTSQQQQTSPHKPQHVQQQPLVKAAKLQETQLEQDASKQPMFHQPATPLTSPVPQLIPYYTTGNNSPTDLRPGEQPGTYVMTTPAVAPDQSSAFAAAAFQYKPQAAASLVRHPRPAPPMMLQQNYITEEALQQQGATDNYGAVGPPLLIQDSTNKRLHWVTPLAPTTAQTPHVIHAQMLAQQPQPLFQQRLLQQAQFQQFMMEGRCFQSGRAQPVLLLANNQVDPNFLRQAYQEQAELDPYTQGNMELHAVESGSGARLNAAVRSYEVPKYIVPAGGEFWGQDHSRAPQSYLPNVDARYYSSNALKASVDCIVPAGEAHFAQQRQHQQPHVMSHLRPSQACFADDKHDRYPSDAEVSKTQRGSFSQQPIGGSTDTKSPPLGSRDTAPRHNIKQRQDGMAGERDVQRHDTRLYNKQLREDRRSGGAQGNSWLCADNATDRCQERRRSKSTASGETEGNGSSVPETTRLVPPSPYFTTWYHIPVTNPPHLLSLSRSITNSIRHFVASVDQELVSKIGPLRNQIIQVLRCEILRFLSKCPTVAKYLPASAKLQPKKNNRLGSSIDVIVFGSCCTNLSLPWSDIDLAITGLEIAPAQTAPGTVSPLYGALNGASAGHTQTGLRGGIDGLGAIDPRHDVLSQLGAFFEKPVSETAWEGRRKPTLQLKCRPDVLQHFSSPQFKPSRHTPLLTLQLHADSMKSPGVASHVDVSVHDAKHTGVAAIRALKFYLSFFPTMRPLVLVLKQVLMRRHMNIPYEGGLSSYALSLMVVAFLQSLDLYDSRIYDIGYQLLNLLAFYADIPVPSNGATYLRPRQGNGLTMLDDVKSGKRGMRVTSFNYYNVGIVAMPPEAFIRSATFAKILRLMNAMSQKTPSPARRETPNVMDEAFGPSLEATLPSPDSGSKGGSRRSYAAVVSCPEKTSRSDGEEKHDILERDTDKDVSNQNDPNTINNYKKKTKSASATQGFGGAKTTASSNESSDLTTVHSPLDSSDGNDDSSVYAGHRPETLSPEEVGRRTQDLLGSASTWKESGEDPSDVSPDVVLPSSTFPINRTTTTAAAATALFGDDTSGGATSNHGIATPMAPLGGGLENDSSKKTQSHPAVYPVGNESHLADLGALAEASTTAPYLTPAPSMNHALNHLLTDDQSSANLGGARQSFEVSTTASVSLRTAGTTTVIQEETTTSTATISDQHSFPSDDEHYSEVFQLLSPYNKADNFVGCRLDIRDPTDPENNVGRPCWNVNGIKGVFAHAYHDLLATRRCQYCSHSKHLDSTVWQMLGQPAGRGPPYTADFWKGDLERLSHEMSHVPSHHVAVPPPPAGVPYDLSSRCSCKDILKAIL